jgi:hypothetical protein
MRLRFVNQGRKRAPVKGRWSMAECVRFNYAEERGTSPTVRIRQTIRAQAAGSAPVLFIGPFVFGLRSV